MDRKRITEIPVEQIDLGWVLTFVKLEFEEGDQNITPLKILEKAGIPIKDQTKQLKYKNYRLKIKKILAELSKIGVLEPQKMRHDTLGIKEDSYKLR